MAFAAESAQFRIYHGNELRNNSRFRLGCIEKGGRIRSLGIAVNEKSLCIVLRQRPEKVCRNEGLPRTSLSAGNSNFYHGCTPDS